MTMKKPHIFAITVLILFFLLVTNKAYAATATPSATPTTTDIKQKQIDDIKERVATKVAQLRQSEKRAIFGTVKSTSVSSFTVETSAKDVKIELTDDILVAQIVKGKRTKLTTEDLAKGDVVTVFGDYDRTLDILKAKAIYIQTPPPLLANGTVTDVDKKEFTVTVSTVLGQSYIVDVEKITKIVAWTKENSIQKAGFSNITVGDSVHVVGTTDPKKENRISALRILTVGNLTGAPGPTPTPTLSPTPTKKISPTPTVKVTIQTTPKLTSTVSPTP